MHTKLAGILRSSVLCCMTSIGRLDCMAALGSRRGSALRDLAPRLGVPVLLSISSKFSMTILLTLSTSGPAQASGNLHKKSVALGLSYRTYRPPLRRAWLQPRQKVRLQNRFQSNNNRFKLLLQQPSLLQLRLTVLTKQGGEECT
jgi:hypothetical protein